MNKPDRNDATALLRDAFGRVHNYLRISVTDKCNLRCSYCMPYDLPRGFYARTTRMTPDEIFEIARIFTELGVIKIRLTGGEPLMRREFSNILTLLSQLPVELALTTNGIFIDEYLNILKAAGVRTVNVSLDSLNPETYYKITRSKQQNKVVSNIHLLLSEGFYVKVNCVVIRGMNDHELLRFVEWTKDIPVHVRFIEFMPFYGNGWNRNYVVSEEDMLAKIAGTFFITKLQDSLHDTEKRYRANDFTGLFGIIPTVSKPFCNMCNRMRLSAAGKMRNCLFSVNETDLLTPLRAGKDIRPLIEACIAMKHYSRGGLGRLEEANELMMPSIGG